MLSISFDVVYKLKMGFTIVQKHDEGISRWRISNGHLESCFCDENVVENNWVEATSLILDPKAKYSFELEKVNKNDWYQCFK